MSAFISYAQNLEDVILNRVFREVESGFYVDVGAWDPDRDSVTRHFYEKDWAGINIEPIEYYYKRLEKMRPRDINLNIAISEREDWVQIVEVVGSGMSSIESEAVQAAKEHGLKSRLKMIQSLPLNEVLKRHAKDKLIHFLKIDVEGHELAVIKSLDWSFFRPVVVIVEAVGFLGEHPDWVSWDNLLVEAQYEFVYFDGLNRFYLRAENLDLKTRFSSPPNFFDGFVLTPNHTMSMKFMSRARRWLDKWLPSGFVQRLRGAFVGLLQLFRGI
jgi:FkbM family methyltransferase